MPLPCPSSSQRPPPPAVPIVIKGHACNPSDRWVIIIVLYLLTVVCVYPPPPSSAALGSVVLDSRIGCMDHNLSPQAERVITSAVHFITGLGDLMFGFPLYKMGIYNDTWKKFAAAQDFFSE